MADLILSNKENKSLFKPNVEDEEYPTKRPTDELRLTMRESVYVDRDNNPNIKLRLFGLENNSLHCYLNSVL